MNELCLECSLPKYCCKECTIPLQQSEIFNLLQTRVKNINKTMIIASTPLGNNDDKFTKSLHFKK